MQLPATHSCNPAGGLSIDCLLLAIFCCFVEVQHAAPLQWQDKCHTLETTGKVQVYSVPFRSLHIVQCVSFNAASMSAVAKC